MPWPRGRADPQSAVGEEQSLAPTEASAQEEFIDFFFLLIGGGSITKGI